mmetsp:Transcript_101067/g.324639  ORF Transcript_101067/g.324639 Transcript_101067/m.324639 type:complete len:238 (+) Transcript_101067:380-1093(+)
MPTDECDVARQALYLQKHLEVHLEGMQCATTISSKDASSPGDVLAFQPRDMHPPLRGAAAAAAFARRCAAVLGLPTFERQRHHDAVEALVAHRELTLVPPVCLVPPAHVCDRFVGVPPQVEHRVCTADGARAVLPPFAVHQGPAARRQRPRDSSGSPHDAPPGEPLGVLCLRAVHVLEGYPARGQRRRIGALHVQGRDRGDDGVERASGSTVLVAYPEPLVELRQARVARSIFAPHP